MNWLKRYRSQPARSHRLGLLQRAIGVWQWVIAWFRGVRHPDAQLQSVWLVVQVAVLLLPFSSLLGSLGILYVAVIVWRQRFRQLGRRPISWGFALLSGLMLLSTGLAINRVDAALGLFNFLPFFGVFLALGEVFQTAAQLRRLAWLLVLGSIPVVIIGLGQQFAGWSGHIQLLWIVVDWIIDPTGNPPGRMAAIFFYANVLASYLVVTFILSVGLWIETAFNRPGADDRPKVESLAAHSPADMTAPPYPSSPSVLTTRYRLGFLTIAVLGNAAALILTDSRNAWGIAALACLAYALYMGWRWLLIGIGIIIGSITGAAFGPELVRSWLQRIVPGFFWARLTDQLYPDRPVAQLRSTQWQFAWSLAQQRPLTGWGLRNFSPLYTAQMHYFIGHPHNLWLMQAAETGFPAALLLFGLVGWVMYQGVLLLRGSKRLNAVGQTADRVTLFNLLSAFMGCALFSLLDVTLFDVRINLLGWLLLAAIAGIVNYAHSCGELAPNS